MSTAPGDTPATLLSELERAVQAALETYSNVHRGTGHHSMVSTRLFDQARDIVLEHLDLDKGRYVVIFCTPRRAERLKALLSSGRHHSASSADLGLPLGVRALVVERKALAKGTPLETGGGTARLVAPSWVVWARLPDRFEPGTPTIVNVIAYAKALRLVRQFGGSAVQEATAEPLTAKEILYEDELGPYSGHELLCELRRTLIGRGGLVPTTEGQKAYVNLDNAASTPTFAPIWDAVRRAWRQPPHVQREIVDEVRSICAEVLGAPLADYDVIFTSNATEAINLVADSVGREGQPDAESVVVNTLLEHNSNELPWRRVPGVSLIRLPVDPEGFIDASELERVLCACDQSGKDGAKRVRLVAVSGASNVLGVFNDLAEISRVVHSHGARLLVDGAQLVAHRKVDVEGDGIDYLAFSGHKAYAPFGTGVLLVKKGLLTFSPTEMEQIRASGEENVAGIAALGKALVLLRRIGFDVVQEEEQALTAHTLRALAQVHGVEIHGVKDPDSPRFAQKGGVIAFTLKSLLGAGVAKALAEQGGIGVRYGCHCAHLLVKHLLKVPPLLEKFQWVVARLSPRLEFPGVVRVSLGIGNTEEDIDVLISELRAIAGGPQAGAGARSASTLRPEPPMSRKAVRRQMDDFAARATERVYSGG